MTAVSAGPGTSRPVRRVLPPCRPGDRPGWETRTSASGPRVARPSGLRGSCCRSATSLLQDEYWQGFPRMSPQWRPSRKSVPAWTAFPVPGSTAAAPAASPAGLGPLLAEALELSRTKAGSSPGDAASTGLADVFAQAYLVLETRGRSESPVISAATAARVVSSVLRPLAAALSPGEGGAPAAAAEPAPASPAEVAWDAARTVTIPSRRSLPLPRRRPGLGVRAVPAGRAR
jgi:hypothetical protein